MTHESSQGPTPRLLSLTAHELRSPLSVVAGYLHMLLGARGQQLLPEHRRLVELANSSCTRALALTHEVSDLARLTAGTAVLNSGSTDIARLAAEAVDRARGRVPDLPITFVQPDDTCSSVADADRLRSALEALIVAVGRELPLESSLSVTVERHDSTDHGGAPLSSTVLVEIRPHRPPPSDGDGQPDGDHRAPTPQDTRTEFDQFRGGLGLSLPVAVLVIDKLGGGISVLPGPAPQGVRVTLRATAP